MANQFLGLSLFIMLLAFFIILNAISDFDEDMSNKAMQSVTVAFSNRDIPQDPTANLEEDLQESFREGDTLDQLQDLFKSQITGVEIKKDRMGTVMHLRMPVSDFERQILKSSASSPVNSSYDLRATLVTLLSSEDHIRYRMEIFLNSDKSPAKLQNENPKKMMSLMNRASFYTEILEEAGLSKKFITPGIKAGSEKMIDLFFRRYEPFNPLGDEEGA